MLIRRQATPNETRDQASANDLVELVLFAADCSEDEWEVADIVDDWMQAAPENPLPISKMLTLEAS